MSRAILSLPLSWAILLTSCGVMPTGVRERPRHFSVAWSKNLDPPYSTGNLPIALNGPTIYEGVLFVGDSMGYMRAFRLRDGRPLWIQRDRDGHHARPTVSGDDLIYGGVDGRVYARHRLTGELRYAVDLGASVESEALIYKGRAFFHTRNHQIFALDVATGKILWSYKRSIPMTTTLQRASRPSVYRGRLFVGLADGSVCSFSLEEGILLWERSLGLGEKFVDVDMEPVFFQGHLYIGPLSGNLRVINAETGQIVRELKDTLARAPKVLDNHLFYLNTEGEVVALDEGEKEVRRVKIADGDILANIIPWRGGLVVSSLRGNLYFLDPQSLRPLETIFLGHAHSAIFGPLSVEKEYLALLSSRGRLYVYR